MKTNEKLLFPKHSPCKHNLSVEENITNVYRALFVQNVNFKNNPQLIKLLIHNFYETPTIIAQISTNAKKNRTKNHITINLPRVQQNFYI